MNIIVANEPRSYREVLASALQALRPHLVVTLVEPDGLDEAVGRLAPHLVLCSRTTELLEMHVPNWVALYPDGAARVLISLVGRRSDAADLELAEILAIVDGAAL